MREIFNKEEEKKIKEIMQKYITLDGFKFNANTAYDRLVFTYGCLSKEGLNRHLRTRKFKYDASKELFTEDEGIYAMYAIEGIIFELFTNKQHKALYTIDKYDQISIFYPCHFEKARQGMDFDAWKNSKLKKLNDMAEELATKEQERRLFGTQNEQ